LDDYEFGIEYFDNLTLGQRISKGILVIQLKLTIIGRYLRARKMGLKEGGSFSW
jgi:hypothetical protein